MKKRATCSHFEGHRAVDPRRETAAFARSFVRTRTTRIAAFPSDENFAHERIGVTRARFVKHTSQSFASYVTLHLLEKSM
jgi:hypothetical protein